MDLRHFEAFIAVAEELHFSRAAERLRIAQPPLSQRIRQMEKELGVALFVRSTRAVSLTPAGESLLGPARKVVSGAAEARDAALAGAAGESGRVTIGFAGASSRIALPQLAGAVRDRFPKVDLQLRGQTYANSALEQVREGSLDLGFVRLPFLSRGVDYVVIEREELICALPSSHRLAHRPTVALSDLVDEPFVTFPANSGSSLHAIGVQACAHAGFQPRVSQAAPDSYTILAMVAAGVGVTLTLSSCKDIQPYGLVYKSISDFTPALHSALAWNTESASPTTHSVVSVAKALFAQRDSQAQSPDA
ncbi:LysR family transcriptional regulator [Rhodococcus sp. 15-649-2-2]|uniref:LysR family transcriptional regulator n=1 Tax=Rhodococcus sp. 15-649-2-2 TaxID=2023140 RepID=UPI000B9AA93A|nr:LysR family transcriptional regulator [Rhodococcus sp. 15-649-2-2]OZE74207.1 LysR family transcriptional regulator [Rhodococcus sp. 15-649-2-2]